MNRDFLLCFHSRDYLNNLFRNYDCDYALDKFSAYKYLLTHNYKSIIFSEEFLKKEKFFISIFVKEFAVYKPSLMVISDKLYFLPELISVREEDIPKVLSSFGKELLEPERTEDTNIVKNMVFHLENLFITKCFFNLVLKGYKSIDRFFLSIIEIVDTVLLPDLFIIGKIDKKQTDIYVSPNNKFSDDFLKKCIRDHNLYFTDNIYIKNDMGFAKETDVLPDLKFFVKKYIFDNDIIFSIIGIDKNSKNTFTDQLIEKIQKQIKTTVFYMISILRQHQMNITDYLTGIYNRRFFDKVLEQEIVRSRRKGNEFSVLFFDIDHFKKINDNYGHTVGDFILKALSELVQSKIRKSDIFARYGGEEFVVLLPETGERGAEILADKLRADVEYNVFKINGRQIQFTISIGLLVVKHLDEANYDIIYKMSDDAMYKAKQQGRNRVIKVVL
jgi:diguanylate cyclase (GGDEF)-like protein